MQKLQLYQLAKAVAGAGTADTKLGTCRKNALKKRFKVGRGMSNKPEGYGLML